MCGFECKCVAHLFVIVCSVDAARQRYVGCQRFVSHSRCVCARAAAAQRHGHSRWSALLSISAPSCLFSFLLLLLSGTDIEPIAQTKLLDRTLQSRGVLLAGVPGGRLVVCVVCVLMLLVCAQLVETMPSLRCCCLLMQFPSWSVCGLQSANSQQAKTAKHQQQQQQQQRQARKSPLRGFSWMLIGRWLPPLLECACSLRVCPPHSSLLLSNKRNPMWPRNCDLNA